MQRAEEQAAIAETQAWRFAGLVQRRLSNPVDEKIMAVPKITASKVNWLVGCTGGAFTFVAPDGRHIRALCEVEKECETWIDVSSDGGKTWQRMVTLTREDQTISDRAIFSVLHPYMYGKIVNGEPGIVLGTSVAEKDTKCWDIHEREVPLAHLEQLKTAYVNDALVGNAEFAYKDGVPIRSLDGKGVYLAATRHHISAHADEAVSADTVFCKLNDRTGHYDTGSVLLAHAARGGIDLTCNRLTCEFVLPDETRFWGCDVRNVLPENAALKSPLKPGANPAEWVLGDFNEITSFAIATWREGALAPKALCVDAVIGRSRNPSHPALRNLGITPLVDFAHIMESTQDDPVLLLIYERADEKGIKPVFQQTIFRRDVIEALIGRGPKLRIAQDPIS